jgi:hypothetical protein
VCDASVLSAASAAAFTHLGAVRSTARS